MRSRHLGSNLALGLQTSASRPEHGLHRSESRNLALGMVNRHKCDSSCCGECPSRAGRQSIPALWGGRRPRRNAVRVDLVGSSEGACVAGATRCALDGTHGAPIGIDAGCDAGLSVGVRLLDGVNAGVRAGARSTGGAPVRRSATRADARTGYELECPLGPPRRRRRSAGVFAWRDH